MYRGLAQAIALGALHGTTTFLPVSRAGHVALFEMLFDVGGIAATEELALTLGTLAATLIIARHAVANLGRAITRVARRPTSLTSTHDGRDLVTVCLAQIPTLLFWLALGDSRQLLAGQPTIIAVGLCVTACTLMSTAWAMQGDRLQPTWYHATLLGVGQGFALMPGISGVGCTIAVALWLGLTKRRSFELAMLVSIPLLLLHVVQLVSRCTASVSWATALTAAAISLGTGLAAGMLLKVTVIRGQMAWFAMWLAPLSIATFAFSRAWPAH